VGVGTTKMLAVEQGYGRTWAQHIHLNSSNRSKWVYQVLTHHVLLLAVL